MHFFSFLFGWLWGEAFETTTNNQQSRIMMKRASASTASKSTTPSQSTTPRKPKSIWRCMPIAGGLIHKINQIRRKKVYPQYFKYQDDAYKRMARVRLPLKTTLLALFLLLVGIVFTPLGLVWYLGADDKDEVREQSVFA
jgi:hypothetical protein